MKITKLRLNDIYELAELAVLVNIIFCGTMKLEY